MCLLFSISLAVSAVAYASDSTPPIEVNRNFAFISNTRVGGARLQNLSTGAITYELASSIFPTRFTSFPTGIITQYTDSNTITISSLYSYQYGSFSKYTPSASDFINYYPYRIQLTQQSTQSTKFSLNGGFGMSLVSNYEDGDISGSITSSVAYVFLYVNDSLVDSWYTPYAGLSFDNYTYEHDSIITSVVLEWQLRGPQIQGRSVTFTSNTLNVWNQASLRLYGPEAVLPEAGPVDAGSINGLPFDDPEGGIPPVIDPDTGNVPEPEPEPNPNQGVEDAINDQTAAQKSFFDSVTNFLHNITQFFTDFFGNLSDFFSSLFVPTTEQIQEVKSEYDEMLTENLGIAYQATKIVDNLFTKVTDTLSSNEPYQFVFPGIKFPFHGEDLVIVEPTPVNLDNEFMSFIRPVLSSITIIVCLLALVNTLKRFLDCLVAGEPLTTAISEGGS